MANAGGVMGGLDVGHELLKYRGRIADERGVNLYVLVDFGAVDLNVDFAGAFGVSTQIAGDAIVKTHADGNEEVGFLNRVVNPGFAVHAHHAEVEGIIGRESAASEELHGDRIIACADELLKGTHRTGNHDAVAGEDDGALGGAWHFRGGGALGLRVS